MRILELAKGCARDLRKKFTIKYDNTTPVNSKLKKFLHRRMDHLATGSEFYDVPI
ncbi:MAG: hypothetical protein IPO26_18315 [Saprospiraceae bacterium]|nr:hypothetical protein [Saprospiraceae bacterium]